MHYWILLKNKQGDAYHHFDNFLPGLVPDSTLEIMNAIVTAWPMDELCVACPLDCRPHVIELESGRKYCTVLFHDAVKPRWRLEDLV